MVDYLIVGGGVIGCALARELARRGAAVTLLEGREAVGQGTTGASVGTLSYSPSTETPPGWHRLASRSLVDHRDLATALAVEVDAPPTWHWPGKLNLVTTNKAEKYTRDRLKADLALGGQGEWLDKHAVHEMEPALAGKVQGASFNPGMGWVSAPDLTVALAEAARRYGAAVRVATPVERLLWEGQRITGVAAGGERYRAGTVVIAAGPRSGRLDARLAVPIEPVRGQAIHIDLSGSDVSRPLVRHFMSGEGIYLIPEADGITVGSTHERVGFRTGNTVGGIAKLAGTVTRLLPALGAVNWQVVHLRSGLRPATPDRLPILGPDPRFPGLWWATGHFRSGILLAPVTAILLADAMADGPPIDESFLVDRFLEDGTR